MNDQAQPQRAYGKVDWGPDEAKGDQRLGEYFVDTPGYQDVVAGRRRYVIGRKGTGKTAILERIRLHAQEDAITFSRPITLRDFPLRLVRDLRNRSFQDKSQFVPIWTFLIATEFARLAIEDNGAQPPEVTRAIRQFLERNFPNSSYGMAATIQQLEAAQAKVSINAGWLNSSSDNKKSEAQTIEVHYQRATSAILDKLRQIDSESTYYLLLDELDEGYKRSDKNKRLLLLALLRAVEEVALSLSTVHPSYRPILALRSDIFDSLEDNDLNKLDDYVLRLDWKSTLKSTHSLRSVVDRRIRASLAISPREQPWTAVALDNDPSLPDKVGSLWQYLTNRTLERPRDIIKFLKYCKPPRNKKLSYGDALQAEDAFSGWLYRELKDELQSHFPIWKESLDCVTRIGKGRFKPQNLRDALEADPAIAAFLELENRTSDSLIEDLFNFGVLGNLSENRVWLFSYKDHDLAWNPDMDLIVHYGFHKKLRIFRKIPKAPGTN